VGVIRVHLKLSFVNSLKNEKIKNGLRSKMLRVNQKDPDDFYNRKKLKKEFDMETEKINFFENIQNFEASNQNEALSNPPHNNNELNVFF
jgi:hypothetical protein